MLQKRTTIAVLAFAILLAVGCGGKPAPTQVAVPAQAPPVMTVAPSITATRPPVAPTTGQSGEAATVPGPTASAVTSSVTTGITEDGHHFWGAPDAPVTMIEFSDFM
jgi:hypothetical protein